VADIRMTPNNNGLLYGIIGALLVVVVAGGFYLYWIDTPASSPPLEAAKPAAPV